WSGVFAGIDPDPANAAMIRQWCVDYQEALHPYSRGGSYVNFIGSDEGDDRVRATYGDHYGKLAQVKAEYDPDNFFRANQNIRPAADGWWPAAPRTARRRTAPPSRRTGARGGREPRRSPPERLRDADAARVLRLLPERPHPVVDDHLAELRPLPLDLPVHAGPSRPDMYKARPKPPPPTSGQRLIPPPRGP